MLNIFSEQFGANGGIHGETTKRVIGRPALDPWDVFLRETVQNSWDAKCPDEHSIEYRVDLTWMTPASRQFLSDYVLVDPPPGLELRELLSEKSEGVALLTVSDRRTRGLGGPTRADRSTTERTDFVDFVRNVGRGHDKQIAGGTYGLGKAVLTGSSSVSTILVFTRTYSKGRLIERFIAVANGEDFQRSGRKFTGRHWWGELGTAVDGPSIEPITGADARRVAEKLGMRIPEKGETGTSIGVLAPVSFHGEDGEGIVRLIANAALYWAWPHMIGGANERTINFGFSNEGEEIVLKTVESDPIFREYVAAYRLAADSSIDKRITSPEGLSSSGAIWSDKPVSRLGSLGIRRFQTDGQQRPDILSNVALMRKPRFIVSYLEVSPDPNGFATAAVFLASDDHDEDFAKSEPVAHDDWNPQNLALEKGNANPVRIALKKIKAVFRAVSSQSGATQGGEAIAGVARFASSLGQLLDGLEGNDAGVPVEDSGTQRRGKGGAGRRGRRGIRLHQPHAVNLLSQGDDMVASFQLRLEVSSRKNLVLSATPRIVTDAGIEEADDELAPTLSAVTWHIPGLGALYGQQVSGSFEGDYEVTANVVQPPDVAIALEAVCWEEE